MGKKFLVYIDTPSFELDADEIWPDGGPENPTAADVVEEMKAYGPKSWVIRDWGLDTDIEIHVDTDRSSATY